MFSYKRVFRPVVPESLPPLRDLKVVNEPLPDEQRRAIGDFLKECLLYKDYLLQEIFRLHSRKETMNFPKHVIKNAICDTIVESQETLTRILSYKPLISAVRDVPPEIWAHIFMFCLPEPSASSSYSSPHSLYQVCSVWRSVALSDPRLWRSVHLTITCHSTKWRATLSRMNYARVMPMHVSVASYDPSRAALVYDSGIREFVRTTSHCWRTLHFVAHSKNIEAFIDADMPALESLIIGSLPRHVPLDPSRLPNIRSLTLEYGCNQSVINTRWPSLTELNLCTAVTSEFLAQFISLNPGLERLALRLPVPTIPFISHVSFSGMTRLISLTVMVASGDNPVAFLEQLHLPSLNHLKINQHGCKTAFAHIRPLFTCLHRMRCPLETLHFRGFLVSESQCQELAPLLPTLYDVRIKPHVGAQVPNVLED